MAPFHLSKQAKGDLRGIARYTLKEWGKAQRNKYIDLLDKAFFRIADRPQIGQERNEIQEGYLSLTVERHLIFYHVKKSEIEIIRILHQSVDIDRQFF